VKLGIQRYFSRVKTPKDNPEIERFNQTLEPENSDYSPGLATKRPSDALQ